VVTPLDGSRSHGVGMAGRQEFRAVVCAQMTQDSPTSTWTTCRRAQRVGRIFLDICATTASPRPFAPLSPRARAGAPVSHARSLERGQARAGSDAIHRENRPALLTKSKAWKAMTSAKSLADAIRKITSSRGARKR